MPTTVTGHIAKLDTTTPGVTAFVRFWLRGTRGNEPRITGTGAIAPQFSGSTFYVDLPADASGNISGTIYSTRDSAGTGSGDIEAGGSHTSVYYGMQVFNSGIPGPEIPVHAKNGGTLDIANVSPVSTLPVVTAPTGDTTYARIDGGNTPFSGAVSFGSTINATHGGSLGGTFSGNPTLSGNLIFSGNPTLTGATTAQNLNNVLYVGTGAYATIQAALNALPANGGVVVCLSGYRETLTSTTVLGSATSMVILMLRQDVILTCNVTSGAMFSVHTGSGIVGTMPGNLTARSGGSVISLASTASVTNVIETADNPQGTIILQNFTIDNVNAGACSGAFLSLVNLNDASIIRDVHGAYFPHIGIKISSTTGGVFSIGPLNIDNCYFDGVHLAGARPLVIQSDGSGATNNVNVMGGYYINPGPSLACIEINGGGGTTGALQQILITGVYTQQSASSTAVIGIKIVDAAGVTVQTSSFQVTDGTSGHTGISINQSGAGRTHSINVQNFRLDAAGGNIGINNLITTTTVLNAVGTGNIPGYIYGGSAGTQTPSAFIFDSDTQLTIAGNKMPQIISGATIDVTAQSAAIATATLYAVPSTGAGQYRVVWDAKVTTAAGTSSTLGALTITYTDPDGTVQTITATGQNASGTVAATATGNTTATMIIGQPLLLNCKASTNIQYAFAYASVAANAMNYNLHIRLESL